MSQTDILNTSFLKFGDIICCKTSSNTFVPICNYNKPISATQYTLLCNRIPDLFVTSRVNWWPAVFRETSKIIWITGKFYLSFCQHFPIVLKDFAIVYYVTIAPYNNKSISRYYVCLSALVLAYFQRVPGLFIRFNLFVTRFIRGIDQAFPRPGFVLIFFDKEEEHSCISPCSDLK